MRNERRREERSERGERGDRKRERERGGRARAAACLLRLRLDGLFLWRLVEVAHDLVIRVAHHGAAIVVRIRIRSHILAAVAFALLVLQKRLEADTNIDGDVETMKRE